METIICSCQILRNAPYNFFFTQLPQELQSRGHLIDHWLFPVECKQGEGPEDAVQQLKRYMELLQTRVPQTPIP